MTSFTYSRGPLLAKAQCHTNLICSGNHVGETWRAFGGTRLFFHHREETHGSSILPYDCQSAIAMSYAWPLQMGELARCLKRELSQTRLTRTLWGRRQFWPDIWKGRTQGNASSGQTSAKGAVLCTGLTWTQYYTKQCKSLVHNCQDTFTTVRSAYTGVLCYGPERPQHRSLMSTFWGCYGDTSRTHWLQVTSKIWSGQTQFCAVCVYFTLCGLRLMVSANHLQPKVALAQACIAFC